MDLVHNLFNEIIIPTRFDDNLISELLTTTVNLLVKRADSNPESFEDGNREFYYTAHRLKILKIIAISSSSGSLMACLIFFYTYSSMHPSRFKFRHVLILILIIYDFLKALFIIIYPIMTLNDSFSQDSKINDKTVDFLGFFTAMTIEGGDLAILAFAIHTCLTIFNPKRQGGLYHWRHIYYVSTVIIPVTLASLAFINNPAYLALDIWCYLPERPYWMRAALSFVPRYVIMAIILVIYCTIYFYVAKQLSKMDKQRKTINSKTKRKRKWYTMYLFKRGNKNNNNNNNNNEEENNNNDKDKDKDMTNQDIIDNLDINIQLQEANSKRLKMRYKIISRQMKTIFLYPVSYFIIRIVPCIGNAFRTRYQNIYAISLILAFVNPANGIVDTIVFMIREKPWLYTFSKMTRTGFGEVELVSQWRYWLRWLPMYKLPKEVIDHYEKVHHLKADANAFNPFNLQLGEFVNHNNNNNNNNNRTKGQDTFETTNGIDDSQLFDLKGGAYYSTSMNFEEFANNSKLRSHSDDTVIGQYKKKGTESDDDDDENNNNNNNTLTSNSNNNNDNDRTNNSNDDEEEEDDGMDFLDFLNKGPVGR